MYKWYQWLSIIVDIYIFKSYVTCVFCRYIHTILHNLHNDVYAIHCSNTISFIFITRHWLLIPSTCTFIYSAFLDFIIDQFIWVWVISGFWMLYIFCHVHFENVEINIVSQLVFKNRGLDLSIFFHYFFVHQRCDRRYI